jgi:hypothetical protein
MVTLENGFLRVGIIPEVGGRIVELRSKVSGRSLLRDNYTEPDFPDLAKRAYLGGFEDNIDRSDAAWKTPYELVVVTDTPNEMAVRVSAEVENPGEGGNTLRIERTMRLRRQSPTLEVEIRYTVLGGEQNVRMMPLCFPQAGERADDSDVFYMSSLGQVETVPYALGSNRDHLFPVDERDGWAAVVDLAQSEGLLTTFAGDVGAVNIWCGRESYTLEPYSPVLEGREVGSVSEIRLTYTPCFGFRAPVFVGADVACDLALARRLLAAGEELGAHVAAVSLRAETMLEAERPSVALRVRIEGAGEGAVDLGPTITKAEGFLVAGDLSVGWPPTRKLPEGEYVLAVEVLRDGQAVGEARLPFAKGIARGSFLDLVTPGEDVLPGTFSVRGAVERGVPRVRDVSLRREGEAQVVRVSGAYQLGKRRLPFRTEVAAEKGANSLSVAHQVTLPKSLDGRLIERLGLALPLSLGDDPHQIRTTCGGSRINDFWRVDQTDEHFPSYLLSDSYARWPRWRLGGVLQTSPTHYHVWKASRADTSPVITDQGATAPGWIDVSCNEWGVTAKLLNPDRHIPWELFADGERGVLTIYLHPPHVAPAEPEPGTLTWRAELHFHEGPHPVGVPRELTDDQFRALLGTYPGALDIGLDGLGLRRGGTDEEKIERIILSNYQPSVFIRGLQGWQVRGICNELGLTYAENREDMVRLLIEHFAGR